MMVRHYKPTVINLADDLEQIMNAAVVSRNDCHSNEMQQQPLDKELTDSLPAPEFDIELRNDFKWLINFNLKEILDCDIDKESPSMVEKQMESHGKENLNNNDYRIPLLDIVEECFLQKNGITIREIFRWISTRYPCFKSKDYKWKYFVRKILNKNPLFKNKKSENRRNDLWYLEKNCSAELNQYYQENKIESTDGNSKKRRAVHRQSKIKKELADKMSKRIMDCYENSLDGNMTYRPTCDGIQTGALNFQTSENWGDTTAATQTKELIDRVKQEDSSEYFEIPVEFQVETVETTLEVANLLDENSTSITLELI